MSELQPILDLLAGKAGWLPTALAWIAALKTASVFVENKIARWAADKLNEIAATDSEDDDVYLRAVFSQSGYKIAAFILRLIGIRLPTLADLDRAIRLQKEVLAESKRTIVP